MVPMDKGGGDHLHSIEESRRLIEGLLIDDFDVPNLDGPKCLGIDHNHPEWEGWNAFERDCRYFVGRPSPEARDPSLCIGTLRANFNRRRSEPSKRSHTFPHIFLPLSNTVRKPVRATPPVDAPFANASRNGIIRRQLIWTLPFGQLNHGRRTQILYPEAPSLNSVMNHHIMKSRCVIGEHAFQDVLLEIPWTNVLQQQQQQQSVPFCFNVSVLRPGHIAKKISAMLNKRLYETSQVGACQSDGEGSAVDALRGQLTLALQILHDNVLTLITYQYGCFLIEHVIEHGLPKDRERIVRSLQGDIMKNAHHKGICCVINKCFVFGTTEQRNALIDQVCLE
uniref:PUM-HD domain-containing protein n=1 Tax=Globodera pallida TaxID=36090 RepID=A0A183CA12_GLOPA